MTKIQLGERQGCRRPLDYILIYQKTPALLWAWKFSYTGEHTRTGCRSPGSRHHSQAFDCSSMCRGMLMCVTLTRGAAANLWFEELMQERSVRWNSGLQGLHEEVMEGETNTRRLREKKGDLCLLGRLNNGGMAQWEESISHFLCL